MVEKFWTVVNLKNRPRTFHSKDEALAYAKRSMTSDSQFAICEATDEVRFTDPPVEVVPIVDNPVVDPVKKMNKDTDELVEHLKAAFDPPSEPVPMSKFLSI